MKRLTWRGVLWTGCASLFLMWHTLALVLAPAPPSDVVRGLFPAFRPYLCWFWLHGEWQFFGPEPDAGRLLRAHMAMADGSTNVVRLTEALQWLDPAYFRFTTLFGRVHPRMPENIGAAARYLARRHATGVVRSVQFEVVFQNTMKPEWYRKGDRPLDPDYLEPVLLDSVDLRQPGP